MNNNEFGNFVETKRKAQRITLRAFAESVGIAPAYLSDIENGNRKPPEGEKLEKILDKLHLTAQERQEAYDLVGKIRNDIAPDIPKYVLGNQVIISALREARDSDASVEDWQEFIEKMKKKRGL